MSFVHSVFTALPPYRYATSEITEKAGSWLQNSAPERALFERLAASTKIEHRNFALPIDDLLALSGPAVRSEIFKEMGGSLLRGAVSGDGCGGALPSGCWRVDLNVVLRS